MPALNRALSLRRKPDLPFEEIGSKRFLDAYLQALLERKGFGDIIAEGALRASRVIGRGTEQLLENTLSKEGFSARAYNGRYFITTALFHATDPTNPMAQLHEVCYPLFKWVLWYVSDGTMSALTRMPTAPLPADSGAAYDAADLFNLRRQGPGRLHDTEQNLCQGNPGCLRLFLPHRHP